MAQIIFNGLSSKPFTLNSYNRTTTLDGANNISSTAYMQIIPDGSTIATLTSLMTQGINHILIKNDAGETIYVLGDLAGKITSMQEAFNGGERVEVYLNLTTNAAEQ